VFNLASAQCKYISHPIALDQSAQLVPGGGGDTLPGPSAHLDTLLSEAPSTGAPAEPLGASDVPSDGIPMSEGDYLSEAFNYSWSPSPDAATHSLGDL
jgi:hypothetical protein